MRPIRFNVSLSRSDFPTAQAMGIEDVEAARRSPQVLVGTIGDVKREIHSRIDQLGITYFSLEFVAPNTMELFGEEIMPEFI